MVEISEGCRTREKYMYWMEFEANRHHFFKVMIGDFRLRLRIPRKFVINFKEKLADTILLKGPSGNSWTVELTRTDEDVLFENGWEEFVRDHSLEDTNFLVFHYDGNSSFKVLIFDATGCEREGCYFVKKQNSSCSNNRSVMQEKEREDNVEVIDLIEAQEDSLQVVKNQSSKHLGTNSNKKGKKSTQAKLIDPDEHISRKGKLKTNEKDTHEHNQVKGMRRCGIQSTKPIGSRQKFRLEMEEETEELVYLVGGSEAWKNAKRKSPFQSSTERRKEAQRTSSINLHHKLKKKEEFSSTQEEPNMEAGLYFPPYSMYFNSNRREVTEEEKQRAYELACKFSSAEPSFLVTMMPTNVYKSFVLTIPKEWATKHMSCQCQEVQLRVVPPSGKKWTAQFKTRPKGCVLRRGWADFVMDNNLEEDDVCIFKLAQGGQDNKKPIILDVIIFRVVEELVPSTRFPNLY